MVNKPSQEVHGSWPSYAKYFNKKGTRFPKKTQPLTFWQSKTLSKRRRTETIGQRSWSCGLTFSRPRDSTDLIVKVVRLPVFGLVSDTDFRSKENREKSVRTHKQKIRIPTITTTYKDTLNNKKVSPSHV